MRIEKEPSGSLKIELAGCELHRFHLTYNQLNYKEKRTRDMLKTLVEHAGPITGFGKEGKLLIEVFPAPAGGCVIYFTSLGQRGKRYRKCSPAAYLFATCEDLYCGAESLGRIRGKSELYQTGQGYVLVLHSVSGDCLKEYGDPFPTDSKTLASLREYGKLLASPNAVEQLLAS